MADFDYAVASPLVADLLAKRDTLRAVIETNVTALVNGAASPYFSAPGVTAAMEDANTSLEALADYVATSEPEG